MIVSLRDLTTDRTKRREERIRQLERERDEREAAIFRRVPRLQEIKALQSEIGLDLARLVLRAPTKFRLSFDELQQWSLRLSAERASLLKEQQIDPAELEVHWDCPVCKNTGWIRTEEPDPGYVTPTRKCQCLIQEEIEDLYKAAGLTGPLREQTFARFDLTVYPPEEREYMAQVLADCKAFSQDVARETPRDSLLLQGDAGLGKTFLASAIAGAVVAAQRTVVYFTFSEFMDLIRLQKFEDEQVYRDGLQRLLDADLIVLDDLGAEKVTDFVAQELFNLINQRINRQKPMVASTNLRPDEVAEYYGERIASRLLFGFEVLQLRGQDVRRILRLRRRNAR